MAYTLLLGETSYEKFKQLVTEIANSQKMYGMGSIIEDISSDEDLLRVEKKLLKSGLLRVEGINQDKNRLGVRKKTILKNILLNTETRDTLYEKTNRIQCDCRRNRSQGDLFRIMKYYCNDITLKEFRKLLFELVNSNRVISFYCPNIKKIVNRVTQDWDDMYDDPGMRIRSNNLPPSWVSNTRRPFGISWYANQYEEFTLKDELKLKSQIE